MIMKPKSYKIMLLAIEEGVREGWHRAHKYNDNPKETDVKEAIEDAVMSSIVEYFTFDENEYV